MSNHNARSTVNQANDNSARCGKAGISAAPRADQQHDAHRAIANEWLQRAIGGIKEMHSSEEARKEGKREFKRT